MRPSKLFLCAAALTGGAGVMYYQRQAPAPSPSHEFEIDAFAASLPSDADTAKARALANVAIQGPQERLPKFIQWNLRAEVGQCPANVRNRDKFRTGSSDFHVSLVQPAALAAATFAEDFHYDDLTSKRLCQSIWMEWKNGQWVNKTPETIIGNKVNAWWSAPGPMGIPKPTAITPGFYSGSMLATVRFVHVYRAKLDQPLIIDNFATRNDHAEFHPKRINITQDFLDAGTMQQNKICFGLLDEIKAPARDLSAPDLDQFFWVQAKRDDDFASGYCGDLWILVGFHLIQKNSDQMGDWFWSTYWWDPQSIFPRLTGLTGAGQDANAWQNYALDAASGTKKDIFNPWKDLEVTQDGSPSNCQFCHRGATFPTGNEQAVGVDLTNDIRAHDSGRFGADFVWAGPKDAKPN